VLGCAACRFSGGLKPEPSLLDQNGRQHRLEIAHVTGNARACGFRPGEDFVIVRLLLIDKRPRDVQDRFHAIAENRERSGKCRGPLRDGGKPAGEGFQRLIEVLSSNQSRAPVIAERARALLEL
jgi:hypothetical protein